MIPLAAMREYRAISERHGMKIHLDGARVFNAAVAMKVPVREIASQVDSVNFCLSKGLGAPIGSLLCGTSTFIDEARIWRKRLGGGMRQAGLLAACGLVSLTQMVDRLEEDHTKAKRLGKAVGSLQGLAVEEATIETNMVLVHTERAATDWVEALEKIRSPLLSRSAQPNSVGFTRGYHRREGRESDRSLSGGFGKVGPGSGVTCLSSHF